MYSSSQDLIYAKTWIQSFEMITSSIKISFIRLMGVQCILPTLVNEAEKELIQIVRLQLNDIKTKWIRESSAMKETKNPRKRWKFTMVLRSGFLRILPPNPVASSTTGFELSIYMNSKHGNHIWKEINRK